MIGKLNVGRNRSAHEALDVILMREALEALKRCVHVIDLAADRIAPAFRGTGSVYDEAAELGRITITKLEQRLLNE